MGIPKGLYVATGLSDDGEYIKKFTDAGGNQLLIANQNGKNDDEIHKHWGQYLDTVKLIEGLNWFYKTIQPEENKDKIDLIYVPIWVAHYIDLPKEQQFFNGEKYFPRSPCPTSIEWIDDRIDHVYHMISFAPSIKKVIFDPEHYGAAHIRMVNEHRKKEGLPPVEDHTVQIWNGKRGPEHICKCARCRSLGLANEKQWHYHNMKIMDRLNELGYGQLENGNAWNYTKYKDSWFFTERTYPTRKVTKDKFKLFTVYSFDRLSEKARARKYGIKNMKISAGIWVERFAASSLLKYIEFIGKNPTYDAYWLYPQTRMRKAPGITYNDNERAKYGELFDGLIDAENDVHADPEFFIKLKAINERIDKYRKSWRFKAMKKLADALVIALSKVIK